MPAPPLIPDEVVEAMLDSMDAEIGFDAYADHAVQSRLRKDTGRLCNVPRIRAIRQARRAGLAGDPPPRPDVLRSPAPSMARPVPEVVFSCFPDRAADLERSLRTEIEARVAAETRLALAVEAAAKAEAKEATMAAERDKALEGKAKSDGRLSGLIHQLDRREAALRVLETHNRIQQENILELRAKVQELETALKKEKAAAKATGTRATGVRA